MYTINIRGKQNPKDTKMVKLEIIFFKTGYARVPKVINITGLLKDWDVKSQSFRVGSAEATTKNKLLFDLRTKYLHVADTWEMEGRNWSPVQLSHCFDEIKAAKPEVKVKSVQQMIDYLEETFKNKKRIKNGQIVDSTTNAKRYVYLKRELQAFTKEKYEKAFSSYFFTDITEEFLLDFAFWLKERGIRNGNKAGLTHKLRLLRAVCRQAEKKEMYGVNMDNFLCLGDDINWPETTSRAVPETVIAKIANVDRTLFTKKEQLHLDLFLFSYYTGGMANVDVCNLTWDLVQEDRIVYERIKFPKTAKPELLSKAKAIMNKYRGQSYGNYVFPVFTHKHTTTSKKTTRVKQISTRLSQTLTKACKMLRIKENITWYSARGSFISKMVDAGNNPYVVAEMAGNSPRNMAQHCTACQLCVSACPNQVLRPSADLRKLMQPEMSYERGYCRPECTKCSEVCPAGAIRPITKADKSSVQIGHAVWVKKNCIPLTDGVQCGNCARHCPTGAIQMVPSIPEDKDSPKIPVINVERCIGCGACENLCPARPFSAIYVEGHERHRII